MKIALGRAWRRLHEEDPWRLLRLALLGGFGVALLFLLPGLVDLRSDDRKLRDLTTEFLDACRDRDFGDIWDIHSEAARRKGMELVRYECRVANVAIPEDMDDEELFLYLQENPGETRPNLLAVPWRWPPEWIDDLRIEEVSTDSANRPPLMSDLDGEGDAAVVLRFEGDRYGPFAPYDVRLVFVRDGRGWQLDHLRIRTFEMPEGFSKLPGIRTVASEDGEPVLAIRVGFGEPDPTPVEVRTALAEPGSPAVVRVEVPEAFGLGRLEPWLRAVARAGRDRLVLRPCRDPLPRIDHLYWVIADNIGGVAQGWDIGTDELVFGIPGPGPVETLTLPVAAGGPPSRSGELVPGSMGFKETPPEAAVLRARIAELEAGDKARPRLLAPEAGTSVWKLVRVWAAVREADAEPVLLALPGPGEPESRILRRGR